MAAVADACAHVAREQADAAQRLSTVHRRFACARLSQPHPPGYLPDVDCNAHHHRHTAKAASAREPTSSVQPRPKAMVMADSSWSHATTPRDGEVLGAMG